VTFIQRGQPGEGNTSGFPSPTFWNFTPMSKLLARNKQANMMREFCLEEKLKGNTGVSHGNSWAKRFSDKGMISAEVLNGIMMYQKGGII
jgi:hypothetical protein